LVLHKEKNGKRIFICHHCGAERDTLAKCPNCNSWKLRPLGIAIDTIAGELEKKFPGREVFELSKDTAKTPKQAREIIKKFESRPGSILLGTEMALLYLSNPIPYTAVISIDSLLSVPEFRI